MSKDKTKTIEETYKKLTQREHILHRPNMYIGDIKKTIEEIWTFDMKSEKMMKRMVEFSPGFLKVFDEVLTNALDHSNRDPTLDKIKFEYSQETGELSIFNTGKGIPVVEHKEHKMYVPEMIFGQLLSSSNYDDSQRRTGAGVNGVGAKATCIFSKKFIIETVDSERGLKFIQEFTDNMTARSKPKITKNSSKSYTKVTFLPDYSRFGMQGLDNDTLGLIYKRMYDCIACTNKNVGIYIQGEKLKGKGLVDYTTYFFPTDTKTFCETFEQTIQGTPFVWEYVVVPWDRFEHVSFVNGNSTYQGGKHVDHVVYQIVNRIKTLIETKKKLKDVRPALIKEKLFIFLRATVVNPQFSSQTKELLTTQVKDFGCRVEVPDKFIDKLFKSSITEDIVEYCKMKESIDLAKATDGKKKNKLYIPKLEDALWAGTAKSDQCTLILTEGDSAKTFAIWGRSVVGNERFGVFPLKGKLLNVRDATVQQLLNNEEINNLKQIIGLKQGKDYQDTSELRYGKVLCLTDADDDGSHIQGLFINFIHAHWPSLVRLNFLQTLKTPIVKAVKGKRVIEFFNQQDYHKWRETADISGHNIRYYKGLGTSTKEDAQSAFRNFENLQVDYYYKDSKCDDAIVLAFEKDKNVKRDDTASTDVGVVPVVKCSDKRKRWLGDYDKDSYIDISQRKVSYQDFINKQLIHFSIYDNMRSIPNLCDGLKPSQRKILYYMLRKNITKPIKVAQLSGYVSAETSYHHGETSLQQAIIGMAQTFIGSNNVNLLYPDGNFGTRLMSGKDAASARYIFTNLTPVARKIFDNADAPLLNYLDDDGQPIEPDFFLPVIPMVLVNGCEGIGTGYSTFVPPHAVKDVIANIVRVLDDKQPLPMEPAFRGFGGTVERQDETTYVTKGKYKRLSDTQLEVTELPVGVWVTPYKEFLETLIESNTASKKDPKKKSSHRVVLKDVKNKTTDENTGIRFLLEFKNGVDLDALIEKSTLEKELKLTKSFSINNMYLFDESCTPVKYSNTTDILLDFCDIRLEYYEKRRMYTIAQLEKELDILKAKVRFIDEYIHGALEFNNKSKSFIVELLEKKLYPKHESESGSTKDYDYLVRLPLISLTKEKIEELKKQTRDKEAHLTTLKNTTAKQLWRHDLDVVNDLC